MTSNGKAYLVGAGPGDPELITLRGKRALEEADVVLYDRLVAKAILDYARPEAELIDVGKRCGGHSVPQDEINSMLVELVKKGKKVVRLKNGDPFVFGRGGEEADALAEEGIPFEVIPGITAAVAAAASCKLPLTKRNVSSCVALITGHEDPTKGHSDIEWDALARSKSTIVIYMAMARLEQVVQKLLSSGMSPNTPAAVISKATTADEKYLSAPLTDLPGLVKERGLTPPSVVIIGSVVGEKKE